MSPMIMKIISLVIAITIICIVLPLSRAENPYSPQGDVRRSRGTIIVNASGGGDYTTIQAAINAANDGDAVYVEAGKYCEMVSIEKKLDLISSEKGKAVIDGTDIEDELLIKITANRVNIDGFTLTNGAFTGIRLLASGCEISNCNITNSYWGIDCQLSDSNTIRDNSLSMNTAGAITLSRVASTVISNNYIYENDGSIYIGQCSGSNIVDNTIRENYCGLSLWKSNSNTISGNDIYSNKNEGISLRESHSNILKENHMRNNTINFEVNDGYQHDIDESNTVNNKPIYYWSDKNNLQIPHDAGCVALIRCNNIVVRDLELSNNDCGIRLISTNNSVIVNNSFVNGWSGISLSASNRNVLSNNLIESNGFRGIYIYDSDDNTVENNTIHNNTAGIDLWVHSCNNSIAGNSLTYNSGYGVEIGEELFPPYGCDDNTIYKNNFIGNNEGKSQAYDKCSNNHWFTSDTGNYWSEWTSPDSNNDGIVDVAYHINGDSNSVDPYPLTHAFDSVSLIADGGTDTMVDVNHNVIFDASNSSDDKGIANYKWTFLYGSEEVLLYGQKTNFTFGEPGTYEVNLSISDREGNVAYDNITVIVNPLSEDDVPVDNDVSTEDDISAEDDVLSEEGVPSEDGVSSDDSNGNMSQNSKDLHLIQKTWFWVVTGAAVLLLFLVIILIIRRKRDDYWDDDDDDDDDETDALERLRRRNDRTPVKKGTEDPTSNLEPSYTQPEQPDTGHELEKRCMKCNALLIPSTAVFCPYCGADQSPANIPQAYIQMNRCLECGVPVRAPLVFCDVCVMKLE